mmetsp:Transcript_41313/g.129964  ORF Transcript_41313/g.129964 Transcript_41313/m.129964 type:complete len:218 (+) Transcript_41313:589-1242(+)
MKPTLVVQSLLRLFVVLVVAREHVVAPQAHLSSLDDFAGQRGIEGSLEGDLRFKLFLGLGIDVRGLVVLRVLELYLNRWRWSSDISSLDASKRLHASSCAVLSHSVSLQDRAAEDLLEEVMQFRAERSSTRSKETNPSSHHLLELVEENHVVDELGLVGLETPREQSLGNEPFALHAHHHLVINTSVDPWHSSHDGRPEVREIFAYKLLHISLIEAD